MGCGKSTLAHALSHLIKVAYIDLDKEITKTHKKTIPELFKLHGEPFFRQQEYMALKTVYEPKIVSTGGGIVTYQKSFDFLHKQNSVIWLDASYATVFKRLKKPEQQHKRPLADPLHLEKRYLERKPLYEQVANFSINVDKKSIAEITEIILGYLNETY